MGAMTDQAETLSPRALLLARLMTVVNVVGILAAIYLAYEVVIPKPQFDADASIVERVSKHSAIFFRNAVNQPFDELLRLLLIALPITPFILFQNKAIKIIFLIVLLAYSGLPLGIYGPPLSSYDYEYESRQDLTLGYLLLCVICFIACWVKFAWYIVSCVRDRMRAGKALIQS